MYQYEENDWSYPAINNVEADADPCFMTRRGLVCRDFRRGIECVHPRYGRSFCYRFR